MWAYKFASETKLTTITGIDWKASKNGYFTPVALLDPVILDGATVSRVTLNNLDYVRERDICIGDTVKVHKAKDIIPEIKEIVNRPPHRENIVLIVCPRCGGDLEMQGIRLTCTNRDCNADLFIEHFAKTIGIKGLGIKSVEKLNLSHPFDLYKVPRDTYYNKLGKNGDKIYEQVKKSLDADVITLLCALNIPSIKRTMLTKIFTEVPDLKVLGNHDRLCEMQGISEITASKIVNWYMNFEATLMPVCKSLGFNLTVQKPESTDNYLLVAVTGKLPMSRTKFTELMKTKGVLVKSITTKTKLLITGDKPGKGNLDKAKKYGVQIVPYYNFIQDLER